MDTARFAAIAARQRPRLVRLASQLLTNRDEAEDATQEALIRLWSTWASVPTEADAERLAVRLTKNASLDRLRSAHRRHHTAMPTDETLEAASTKTDSPTEEQELRQALEQAANRLPRRERELWLMHAEAAMPAAEISATTGIPVRSVSVMLSTARRKIYEHLKKGGFING